MFIINIIKEHVDNKLKIIEFDNPIQRAFYLVYEDLRLVSDVLFKNTEDISGNQALKFVLPHNLLQVTIKHLHKSVFAGHMGLKRTLKRVLHSYHRPFLKEQITTYVREKIKRTQVIRKAKLVLILPTKPRELATFDIAGPFVLTPRGHKYPIVKCDHLTKFVAVYPLKDMMAETIADILIDYMCKYGMVETVLSDLGTNFMIGSKLAWVFWKWPTVHATRPWLRR